MPSKRVVGGVELGKALAAAGLVPDNCSRMIVDVQVNDVVRVYYTCFGDEDLLRVVVDLAREHLIVDESGS